MSDDSSRRKAITAYLKLLGNPYAKTQIEGLEPDVVAVAEPDLRAPTDAEREYARKLGNQYALLSIAVPTIAEPTAALSTSTALSALSPTKATLSKADFVVECRRVFAQYIPSVERGRLRPHHRNFISRNQNRPPAVRYALAHQLRKYDISSISGVAAQFNREREELTDQKLRQIERIALPKEPQSR